MKSLSAIFVGALLFVGIMAVASAQEVSTAAPMLARQDATGAAVYQAKCASCHQVDGAGIPGAFPPLAGNPKAADSAYVESVVTGGQSGPLEVLGATYNSVMPAVDISDEELAAVVAYVATLADGGGQPPSTTAAPPSEGDAASGEKLFKGTAGFVEGAAACAACHSAGDIGFRGGSGLGPDLSDVFTRFGGEAGLAAWLSSPASATMQPLFVDKPLSSGEIADLTAFLATTTDASSTGGFDQVLIAGGLGLLALLGLMALFIRGPNESYNQRLRRKT